MRNRFHGFCPDDGHAYARRQWFTLAQLSYWTAKHLGDTGLDAMKERGRVQVGKVADLTLFDPSTVAARATYKEGENGLPVWSENPAEGASLVEILTGAGGCAGLTVG